MMPDMQFKLMTQTAPDWFISPRFSIWMHRGDRVAGHFPELAMSAIEEGFNATGKVELDIQFAAAEPGSNSKDVSGFPQRLMVHHDSNTKRMTGQDHDISSTPVSVLRHLRLVPPSNGGPSTSGRSELSSSVSSVDGGQSDQHGIPVLDQVLQLLETKIKAHGPNFKLNIEMKAHSEECCTGVMQLLDSYFLRGVIQPTHILISSLHSEVMTVMEHLKDHYGVELGLVVSGDLAKNPIEDSWAVVTQLHEEGRLSALSLPIKHWNTVIGLDDEILHDAAVETGLKIFYFTPTHISELETVRAYDLEQGREGPAFHGAFIDDSHTFL